MMMTTKIRTYTELSKIDSFYGRFKYLQLNGEVAKETFGFERYLNQSFYRSKEWRDLRNHIIERDMGCDMGLDGYEIGGTIIIHHMNPVVSKDILDQTDYLMNPEYLICVSHNTHNAIHYGGESGIMEQNTVIKRMPNDTCPWRK